MPANIFQLIANNVSIDTFKRVLDSGDDVLSLDVGGETVLITAVKYDRVDFIKAIFKYQKALPLMIDVSDILGNCALHYAAKLNFFYSCKLLLSAKAALYVKDKKGNTPLIIASMKGHADIVDLLAADGDCINETNNEGLTALMYASMSGHTNIAMTLLDAGANMHVKSDLNKWTALSLACTRGHYEMACVLIRSGAYLFDVDSNNITLLMAATMNMNNRVVKLLLDEGVDIDKKDHRQETALMKCVERDNFEAALLILTAGCTSKNDANIDGNTAMDLAIEDGNMHMVELLESFECSSKAKT